MPKLSIIIPIYNAAKTVASCVDSLLNQTLVDMEVIIVDDHGQDNSIEIIQNRIAEHARKDMFRFTETTVNSGPGAARNLGLQIAQGEYVAFIDSDDWVEMDMYLTLYNAANQHSSDICYCNAFLEDSGKSRVLSNISVQQGLFVDEDKRKFLTNFKSYFWSYIYRREMLNQYNITFPLEKSAEDSYFLTCSILCTQRIASVNRPMYHYVCHSNSLSRSKNEKRYIDKLSVFNRLFEFAKTHNLYDVYEQELQFIYIKKAYLMACVDYLTQAKHPQTKILQAIYQELISICPKYADNTVYKKHFLLRSFVLFLHRMPTIACLIFPPILKKDIL